jgi:hypothetical protein
LFAAARGGVADGMLVEEDVRFGGGSGVQIG